MNPINVFRPRAALLAVAGCVALSACGDKTAPAAPAAKLAAAKAAPARKDGLPPPVCPAPATASEAAQGPDIAGLQLGEPAAQALDRVRCEHPDAVATVDKRFISDLDAHGIALGPQQVTLHIGEARPCDFRKAGELQSCGVGGMMWTHEAETIQLGIPGQPGQARVMSVWRAQRFKPGAGPAMDKVVQALEQKYGPPQWRQLADTRAVQLHWARDPRGTPLSQAQMHSGRCPTMQPRIGEGLRWASGCGLTMVASVVRAADNPLLAREIHVGMLDQQRLLDYGDALQAELTKAAQQRNAEQATRNGDNKVKL